MYSTLGGRSYDGDAIRSLNEPKPNHARYQFDMRVFGSSVAQDVAQSVGCYSRF